MLITYGKKTVTKHWSVSDDKPFMFSRIYYVLGGDVEYISKKEKCKLKQGYLYCFPTNIGYRIVQDEDNRLNCFYMDIDIAPMIVTEVVEILVEKNSFLESMISTCIKYCEQYPINVKSSLSNAMAVQMVEYLKSIDVLKRTNSQIETSIGFIVENIDKNISVEKLSKMCGYHPQHYIRLFSKTVGITPHQYIISYRMKKALYYIIEGKTVKETSKLVGYLEDKNFSRAFKNYFGVTPTKAGRFL